MDSTQDTHDNKQDTYDDLVKQIAETMSTTTLSKTAAHLSVDDEKNYLPLLSMAMDRVKKLEDKQVHTVCLIYNAVKSTKTRNELVPKLAQII